MSHPISLAELARALSSPTRLHVLQSLKDPESFTSRREGDLSEDGGVCVSLIAEWIGVSQPTTSRHLEILRRAGLVYTKRVAQRNFHYRDEQAIQATRDLFKNL